MKKFLAVALSATFLLAGCSEAVQEVPGEYIEENPEQEVYEYEYDEEYEEDFDEDYDWDDDTLDSSEIELAYVPANDTPGVRRIGSDTQYTYKVYEGTEYEFEVTCTVNIDDYLYETGDGKHFNLPLLCDDLGWYMYDGNGKDLKNPLNGERVAGAYYLDTVNDIETGIHSSTIYDGHQYGGICVSFYEPHQGDSFFPTNEISFPGLEPCRDAMVNTQQHEVEIIFDGMGYDGWGELTCGMSYDEVLLWIYAMDFVNGDTWGENPFYYLDMPSDYNVGLFGTAMYELPDVSNIE